MSGNVSEITFHVRYAETDQMGIVHHASYIVWFEEARSAMMRGNGVHYTDFEADGYELAVSEVQARYLAPARYDRLVTVRTTLSDLRSRSMAFSYEILDTETEQLLVTGQSKHVCIDRQGRVAKIPDTWRDLFSQMRA